VTRSAIHPGTNPTLLSVAAIPGLAPAQVVVEVAGEVTTATAPLLQLCLDGQADQDVVRELVVDLRRVAFLGAAGVRVLQRARERCEARGARFVVRPSRAGAAAAGQR
jgi:anti-anti-sigma factor